MPNYLAKIYAFAGSYAWLVQMALLVLLGAVLAGVIIYVADKIVRRFKETPRIWDDTLAAALKKPLLYLLTFIILTSIWRVGIFKLEGRYLLPHWDGIYQVVLILFFFAFAMRYVAKLQVAGEARNTTRGASKSEHMTLLALSQVARIFIICFSLIVLLQTLGIKMSALLALGGVGGIAVGFAAKDTLANFLGGVMIYVDRPFEVGDWIASPDNNIEGTVEKIGWRLTKIRAFDKRPLYVPNALFSTLVINNPSRMTNRRIKTSIGVRYDDAMSIGPMLAAIEAMLKAHDEIDQNQTIFVNLVEFGASSLNFLVYAFTKTVDWVKYQQVQQDVFLKIIGIIDEFGAECAFPTRTLELPRGLQVAIAEPENQHEHSDRGTRE
jgi:MscS family membrane protein